MKHKLPLLLVSVLMVSLLHSAAGLSRDSPLVSSLEGTATSLRPDMSGRIFATRIGGLDSENNVMMEVDDQGNVIIAGTTSSQDFQTLNAHQDSINGSLDIFVSKIADNGTLLWSTYYGGGGADLVTGLFVDSSGDIILSGYIYSQYMPQYPVSPTLTMDSGFIVKFSSSGQLVWRYDFSGSLNDDVFGVTLSPTGDIYLAGMTESNNFPTKDGYDMSYNGNGDAFLLKMEENGTIVWGTYFGGSDFDAITDLAADITGNVWVVGITESNDMPLAGLNSTGNSGGQDAFVAQFNSSGALVMSTQIGGNGRDRGLGIEVDSSGDALVSGTTQSADFPTSHGDIFRGETESFLVKLNPKAEVRWSRTVGGSYGDDNYGLTISEDGSTFVTGETYSSNYPVVNSYSPRFSGATDGYVTLFDGAGDMRWSSLFGGADFDSVTDVETTANDTLWIAGVTSSSDFIQGRLGSGGLSDIFIARYVAPRADYDADGMDNAYEISNGLNVTADDATLDLDGDGLTNIDEYKRGTAAGIADTDGDGIPDGWEVQHGLDPLIQDADEDTDLDGLSNLQEYREGTDPDKSDSDGDKLPDGYEVENGLDPLNPSDAGEDTDGDGLTNLEEYELGTNPVSADSDSDGIPDKFELDNGLDPNDPSDASEDPDDDGLTNREEYENGTDMNMRDTDEDGMPDGWEVQNGLDPLDPKDANEDPDGDGYSNFNEYNMGLDPNKDDSTKETTVYKDPIYTLPIIMALLAMAIRERE